MDVEMQMEAQGLPTKFESTSDQAEQSHLDSNTAATTANSEAATAPAPELKPVTIPGPPILQAELSPEADTSPAPNGVVPPAAAPTQNGSLLDDAPVTNGPSMLISQHLPDVEMPATSPPEPPIITSTPSLEDSIVPSSIPAELPPPPQSTQATEMTMDPVSEPSSIPQAPTSDLRTSPHADDLTPSQVAVVEEQKHAQDNAAAESELASSSEPVALPPAPVTSANEESSKVGPTGLATPPTQSPPPAPQPEPATLPDDPPAAPATEVPEPVVVPLEQPLEPAPTPAEPAVATNDQIMTDVASPPAKIAREREEDQDDTEPAAKRMKTDEPDTAPAEFKVPEAPAAASSPGQTNGTPPAVATPSDGDDTITPSRLGHMKKVISNLKKSNASAAFRTPVDPVALNIPNYTTVITKPMDLGTIDNKLKHNDYTNVANFISDFNLIVENCVTFNGPDHAITQQARKMQTSFNNQMSHLPQAAHAEPSKEEKRAAKAKQEPTRTAPPRRPSVSTAPPPPPTGSARSPRSSTSGTQAFAVNPDGMPLIRRDSNMADGRPKRQIVPPKRNQEYQGGRPKKKKYELQLRFCQEVLKEIMAPKHWQMNQYFTHPVDPVALNIPTYFQIVKKPMDLGTVQTKLENNVYEKAKDFEEDVRQVFKNCYKFNPEGDFVNQSGHQLEELFDKKWATKEDWIAAREPTSEPQSDEEDEDEESEDDGEDSEVERNEKIANLQKAIAEMSKQMGELTQTKPKKKKSKSPSTQPKKSKSKSGKKDKPKATFPGLQKPEKKKSISKSKPEKERYVTFAEKQYISNGIAMLPEKQMQEALKIIQQSVPSLANSDQNEIELDIEEVPNHALLKLLQFVKKYAGPPPDEPKSEADSFSGAATTKSKKSKPQSKHEQEREIEELQGKLGAYARGGPVSPNAVQSIETGDSSDDDGDSEESEEE